LIDVHFVRLGTFDRTAKGLLSDEDQRAIERDIAEDPEASPVISDTGGVRKIRGRLGQRGKRGGVRILYVYVAAVETVYLLLAYSKNARKTFRRRKRKR
jgi:mRNA-degrading endonuclease RelE of RelBE toxin-antitoxin system